MVMEVQRDAPGHWHFSLGPVEKGVVKLGLGISGTAIVILLSIAGWWARGVSLNQTEQGAKISAILTQQAVQTAQMVQATSANIAVSNLNDRVTQIEVRQQFLMERMKESGHVKGLQ